MRNRWGVALFGVVLTGCGGQIDTRATGGESAESACIGCNTPYCVHGAIGDHYLSLGGCGSVLGAPVTNETVTTDRLGRFNFFQNDGGIWWTPLTGAWAVHGKIFERWSALGGGPGEKSWLGYPTSDEYQWGNGRRSDFQNGFIYWDGANATAYNYPNCLTCPGDNNCVGGAIRNHYTELGGCRSILGSPTTFESKTPDGIGRYNHFQNGASIYWTPGTGAWSVRGKIRSLWASMGWETSWLGYPVSDEYAVYNAFGVETQRQSAFQFGTITYDEVTGNTWASASPVASCTGSPGAGSGVCSWGFVTPQNLGWYPIPGPVTSEDAWNNGSAFLAPSPGWSVAASLSYSVYPTPTACQGPSGASGCPLCLDWISTSVGTSQPIDNGVNSLEGLEMYIQNQSGNERPLSLNPAPCFTAQGTTAWCYNAQLPQSGGQAICPAQWCNGAICYGPYPQTQIVVTTDDYVGVTHPDSGKLNYMQFNREVIQLF